MATRTKTRKTLVGSVAPEALAFTVGRDPERDLALVAADCVGSAAHITMLSRRLGIFTPRERNRVVAALRGILRAHRRGRFRIRPEDQDVHLAVERALTREGGDLGRRVHTARSRNDQVAVDLRLYAREQILAAIGEAAELAGRLLAFARRYDAVPMVGRTHGQPAMPSSVGLWASAHAESLLDDIELLRAAYALNDRSPLGSAAGYGVPVALDRRMTARLLGFRGAHANVVYAGNARGKCEAAILSAMSQVMLTLSRFASDLILFAMPEFGYFRLPPECGTGSSIMPQKNNPDALELVRARAARVLACHQAVAEIVRGLPSGYNRDLQETKEPFMLGIETTRACLRICSLLAGKLRADRKALRAGFRPEVFAADRALDLAVRGVAFRDAYRRVKADLDELRSLDVSAEVARRMRRYRAIRADYAALGRRTRLAARFAVRERRRSDALASRLLGMRYVSQA